MPIVTREDIQVINSPSDTSGNGGRKLVKLENGWLVAGVLDSSKYSYFYVSKDGGNTFEPLCRQTSVVSASGILSLVAKGNVVYSIQSNNGLGTGILFNQFDATTVTNTDIYGSTTLIEIGQTSFKGASMTINEEGTELHAVWASKNSTLSVAFNVRYRKGIIGTDGNVVWDAVEQVTLSNHGSFPNAVTSPTITLDKNGVPCIIAQLDGIYVYAPSNFHQYAPNRAISIFKRDSTLEVVGNDSNQIGKKWSGSNVEYNKSSYDLSLPSAIFVPQRINVLDNGRIWVSWHGVSSATSKTNIYVSYSDNGGVTWSVAVKLTDSANMNPKDSASITANKDNEIFVVFRSYETSYEEESIQTMKHTEGSWGISAIQETNGAFPTSNPSTLFDNTFNLSFSKPLFIYKSSDKVGFYGKWYINSTLPLAPSTITVPTSVTHGVATTISWSAVTIADADDSITYQADYYANGKWNSIFTGVTGISTSVTIPNPTRAGLTKFRVRAHDGYDYGDYIESDDVILIGSLGGNVSDTTVVASAYDTSGNGGRKLVKLDNGWLVTAVYASTPTVGFYIYKSIDNGITWTYVTKSSTNGCYSANDISLVNRGDTVYLTSADVQTGTKRWSCYVLDMTTTLSDPLVMPSISLDTGQSNIASSGTSLTINEAKTELHAVWSSRNANRPNSSNIRYSKGLILEDGSVSWGLVELVTLQTANNYDRVNPSITLDKNGIPLILFNTNNGYTADNGANYTGIAIQALKRDKSLVLSNTNFHSSWSQKTVYIESVNSTYAQSFPSVIFVPQSINGLANGRLWVAWHGNDATETNENIRVSYSDDGGITWSAMQKLTSGQIPRYMTPSITSNKKNEVFIIATKYNYDGVIKIKNTGGSWGSVQTILADNGTTASTNSPSTLFDLTVDMSEPLFVYRKNRAPKVGFYGTWNETFVTTKTGFKGIKTDKNNILSYSILSDITMPTVYEKLNGVVVGTKTPTSGQPLSISLTDEQWDEVKYGKYTMPNLIPPFTQWTRHANAVVVSDYELRLVATGAYQSSYVVVDVLPNETYCINATFPANAVVEVQRNDTGVILKQILSGSSGVGGSFTIPSGVTKVKVLLLNGNTTSGTYTFTNPQLELGSIPTSFKPSSQMENTITIEMGREKWTYTFDKRLATDADLLSTVKAVQDSQIVYLPIVKSKLASALRNKGVTINNTDSFEEMAKVLESLSSKKFASGTVQAGVSTVNFKYDGGSSTSFYLVTVTGLDFKPSTIVLTRFYSSGIVQGVVYSDVINVGLVNSDSKITMLYMQVENVRAIDPAVISQGTFTLPTNAGGGALFNWVAYE